MKIERLSLLVVAIFCAGCMVSYTGQGGSTKKSGTSSGSVSGDSSIVSEASGKSLVSSQDIYLDLSGSRVSLDCSEWTDITVDSLELSLESGTAQVKFTEEDDGSSTGLIKLNLGSVGASTSVHLSGTMTSGGVKIQTNPDYETGVYLEEVNITSSSYPCIDITKGGAASVFIADGTSNVLKDGRSYGTGYGEEYATTSLKTYTDDEGNTQYCTKVASAVSPGSDSKGTLYCKGGMTISGSGTLTVTQAYKNCIASKGYLKIQDGIYVLTSTGKSGLVGDQGVIIDGGSITYTGTGAVSASALRKATAIKTDEDDYPTSCVKVNGGTVNATVYNGKGIAAPYVEINGGTNSLNITGVTGYTSEDRKSGTYLDADGVSTSGSIVFAAEGVEAVYSIKVSGGETTVNAVDDGMNVSNTGATFSMSGGFVDVCATRGDGIDCNGNISISGGNIVSIATTGSEHALDWGDGSYTCRITGGYIAGLSGSAEAPGSVSNAGVLIMSKPVSSGATIAVGSGTSSIGYAFTVPAAASSYSYLFMCSPQLSSSSYSVYKNCSVSGGAEWNGLYYQMPVVTSSGTSTSVSLSSHIYSEAKSGGPGMQMH